MSGKRLLVLVNPRSGKRRRLIVLEKVKPVFAAAGIDLEVRVTERPGHARQVAKTFDLTGYRGLCLVGGDGTVHEAVGGLVERGAAASIPLGIIAAGTGNTLLDHLGLAEPMEAARRIVAGRTCPIDVARIEARDGVDYCVVLVGWGGIADINVTAEKLRWMGPPRYAAGALWNILTAKPRAARLVLDGRTIEDKFLFVIACNSRYAGSKMDLAPRAEIADGKIDVVLVRTATRPQMLRLFAKVFDGSHVTMPCVEYYQVRSLAIDSEGDDVLDLDGEIKGAPPISLKVLPRAVQVFA